MTTTPSTAPDRPDAHPPTDRAALWRPTRRGLTDTLPAALTPWPRC